MPFVVLGIVLSIVVRVWLPEAWIVKVLPRTPWLRRMVVSLIGMFLPVCECGNVPLARGLMVRGLTVAESMTFLFAAPIINPITIITTHQAFGFDDGILVARLAGGFVIANLLGWVFSRHPEPEKLLTTAVRGRMPAARPRRDGLAARPQHPVVRARVGGAAARAVRRSDRSRRWCRRRCRARCW